MSMKSITLTKCDDGSIEVTTNADGTKEKYQYDNLEDREKFIISLAHHLMYEPAELLNLSCFDDYYDDYDWIDQD